MIFSNVNEWLKFAETKNGALIAFNSACIFGVLTIANEGDIKPPNWYVITVVTFVLISTLISFSSLFPRTKIKWSWLIGDKKKKTNDHDNMTEQDMANL